MSYESTAEPIKIGYLMDFKLPDLYPQEMKEDLLQSLRPGVREALEQGLIDRPIEIIYRRSRDCPKGSVKAVIDAYGELVDEGCLVVFGPHITDNCVPTREAIEERFKVPALSVTGSDDWLGEWTFSFPQGSLTDEPIFWADLARQGRPHRGRCAHRAVARRRHLSSRTSEMRVAARAFASSQKRRSRRPRRTSTRRCAPCTKPRPKRSCICGFGFGIVFLNPALEALDWDPPRFTSTAFQNAWINPIMWNAFMGWTGVDQYDEGNAVGQDFLDQYEAKYNGRRPEYCVPVVNHDVATTLLRAFTDAHPLSPRGVKEALERVKMMPAAAGAPGTRVSFGNWTRRAWMGAGYLVARKLDADGVNSHLVDRFGEE